MSRYICPECGSDEVFIRKTILVEEHWCGDECEQEILDEVDVYGNMYAECEVCGELCEDTDTIYDEWAVEN